MRGHAIRVALVVALAACSTDGVSIEIHRGSTGAVRVELYIVDGLCTTDAAGERPCLQLKPPSASEYLDGEVYTRHEGSVFAAAVDSEGFARFTIRANGVQTHIPLAIAVGFDAGGTRIGAVLLRKDFYTTDDVRVLATLSMLEEATVSGRPGSDGLRVETWYEAASGSGCLVFEDTVGGTSDRKFIVPADDLDCDGWVPPLECDAQWPHRDDDSSAQLPFTCVTTEAGPASSGPMCLLGETTCTDGLGPSHCAPATTQGQRYCVPSALCDPLCGDSTDPTCLYQGLRQPRAPALKHPSYLKCVIPYNTEGGGLDVCNQSAEVVLTAPWMTATGRVCTKLELGVVAAGGPFTFAGTYDFPSGLGAIQADVESSCTLILNFGGIFDPSADLANAVPGLVMRLDLESGMSLVVPMVVVLQPQTALECATAQAGCSMEWTTAFMVDASLEACTRL